MTASALLAIATVVAAVGIAACGGSSRHRTAATRSLGGSSQLPAANDAALSTGTAQQRIAATARAFYRYAVEDQAAQACALFSPAGRAGFMRAAKVSFPGSINQFSTCTEAMRIYYASLQVSLQNLQTSDPSVSLNGLKDAAIGEIRIHGDRASAIGPLNGLPIVNPKQLYFVRIDGRWLINGSYSLSKSDLPRILAEARKGVKRIPPGGH